MRTDRNRNPDRNQDEQNLEPNTRQPMDRQLNRQGLQQQRETSRQSFARQDRDEGRSLEDRELDRDQGIGRGDVGRADRNRG